MHKHPKLKGWCTNILPSKDIDDMQIIQTKFEGDALIKIMKTSLAHETQLIVSAFQLSVISFLKGIEG